MFMYYSSYVLTPSNVSFAACLKFLKITDIYMDGGGELFLYVLSSQSFVTGCSRCEKVSVGDQWDCHHGFP